MKYYLIAGEKSGDVHGGNLMRSLLERDPEAQFRGFGGDAMQRAGLELVTHHRDMDFVGLIGLVAHVHTIYKKLRQCKRDIVQYNPQVIILIDYGGFNMRIARFCTSKGIRVFYYIPPKVWAWARFRARTLRASVDRLFCVLPFEKAFYRQLDWEVDYVGNPVLDAVRDFRPSATFLQQHDLSSGDAPIIALLPGSRKSELKNMVSLFCRIVLSHPQYRFVVAAVHTMPAELYTPLAACPNATLIEDAPYDVLTHARAAIVASGTATLETALLGVPQVVLYKAAPLEYFLMSLLLQIKYVSLVNLIADTSVVKEYLQRAATVRNLSGELRRLIEDTDYRTTMMEHYDQIRRTLDIGSASQNAARLMVEDLHQQLGHP